MADPAFDLIFASSGSTPTTAGGANTITFQYAPSRGPVCYAGMAPALMGVRGAQAIYAESADFAIAYGATIVVTLGATVPAMPANSTVYLQLPVRDTSGTPLTSSGMAAPAAEAVDYIYS